MVELPAAGCFPLIMFITLIDIVITDDHEYYQCITIIPILLKRSLLLLTEGEKKIKHNLCEIIVITIFAINFVHNIIISIIVTIAVLDLHNHYSHLLSLLMQCMAIIITIPC